ncbi:meiosis-specific kinetochore protein [Zootoca vivipara]|uniref:meiosis-specific kinetochore protein n=1 Tax=Zootoca vivipara TaxID=8524 RepID=UPI00293BD241|nr:meiosis-specific kinetochore protein [Zootoca vivipara]
MDWVKLRSYSRKKRAQRNVHCASPLPAAAASAAIGERNAKAKGSRQRLDLLSEPRQEPRVRRQIGNAITKSLPKIQEASGVTQMDCLSMEQSTELNENENRSMEVNKSINKITTAVLKDSLHLSSASKESPRYSETTSGMTLPTGVSHFLLQCLDEESSLCSDTESSDGASTYSSPEIFRDENTLEKSCTSPEECLGHRNSTLLDTSKAINIDKMPHVPNLSQILETVYQYMQLLRVMTLIVAATQSTALAMAVRSNSCSQGNPLSQREHIGGALHYGRTEDITKHITTFLLSSCFSCFYHGRLSKQKSRSELTDVSAVVAGKQVCKIFPAKEKTPELQSFGASLLPQKQTKKTKDQQPRKMKCTKRVLFSSSSPYVSSPAKSCGITAETLGSAQPGTGMLDSSSVHKVSLGEASLPSTSRSNVNSKEVIPASLSPESVIRQCLRNPPEICCIIKASPGPLKVLQHPLKRKRVFPPPGATEDIITSSKY